MTNYFQALLSIATCAATCGSGPRGALFPWADAFTMPTLNASMWHEVVGGRVAQVQTRAGGLLRAERQDIPHRYGR